MSSAVRAKTKTKATPISRSARSSSSNNAAAPASPVRVQQASAVKQLELVELLHKSAVIEIVIAEVEPSNFEVQLVVAWRYGRSVLTTSAGHPRSFRSLDSLTAHLKTLGIGSTLVRLELLA